MVRKATSLNVLNELLRWFGEGGTEGEREHCQEAKAAIVFYDYLMWGSGLDSLTDVRTDSEAAWGSCRPQIRPNKVRTQRPVAAIEGDYFLQIWTFFVLGSFHRCLNFHKVSSFILKSILWCDSVGSTRPVVLAAGKKAVAVCVAAAKRKWKRKYIFRSDRRKWGKEGGGVCGRLQLYKWQKSEMKGKE